MRTLPHFNDLMALANATLHKLNIFDLDSTDPASVEDFGALEDEYREDARALVDFVAANHAAILAELN
jgi:hypothetical protein